MDDLRSILLVDAKKDERGILAAYLRKKTGCTVVESDSPGKAIDVFKSGSFNLVISDIFLPKKSGLDMLKKIHQLSPGVVTIAALPEGDRELVVEILGHGMFSCLQYPYIHKEATIIAARALAYGEATGKLALQNQKFCKSDGFSGIIGDEPKMRKLFSLIEKVAGDDAGTVLIRGESGTGKELVAHAIHNLSPRQANNFVPLNCAAIPGELLESELFGYVKGAFTGAARSKIGRVEYADNGTLFLDEIGDMSPTLQAKLLRVLQEREFEPVGGLKPVKVNIRVVAATHRDLEQLVAEGSFREDLYYRLNVLPITIPPLRDRRMDIPLLIDKFVHRYNNNKRVGLRGFDRKALAILQQYPWPGNVRELENLVQRMSIIYDGCLVGVNELPEQYLPEEKGASLEVAEDIVVESASTGIPASEDGMDFNLLTSEFENQLIRQALTITSGNKKEAAQLLNLKRTTLLEKIKKKRLDDVGKKSSMRAWS